ncbi:uncharacterized protein PgNI_09024 [Pyricularia grisea]|uniref:Uncharacterized protein n=1 Tax=Pyricularia grisea TaxID=148305 RepID=A0A6P8AW27_PYRGI|nr:uncharacterized protein PgNI_09024 [Pyricularia grisea]TLD06441.1 hypothetical protein PgNI_09024 [Pyricularia grisea]
MASWTPINSPKPANNMSSTLKSAKKAQSVAGGSPAAGGGEKLTERELLILSKAWGCMKTQPEIDMPKLAQELGMTNVGSATNAWGRIKKKLFSGAMDSPGGAGGGGGGGRKRRAVSAAAADDDDDDDDNDRDDEPSPTKRAKPASRPRRKPGRKAKTPAATAADENADDSEDDDNAKKEAKTEDGYIKPEKKDDDDEEDGAGDDGEGDMAGTA